MRNEPRNWKRTFYLHVHTGGRRLTLSLFWICFVLCWFNNLLVYSRAGVMLFRSLLFCWNTAYSVNELHSQLHLHMYTSGTVFRAGSQTNETHTSGWQCRMRKKVERFAFQPVWKTPKWYHLALPDDEQSGCFTPVLARSVWGFHLTEHQYHQRSQWVSPIPSLRIPLWLTSRLYNCSCYVNAK